VLKGSTNIIYNAIIFFLNLAKACGPGVGCLPYRLGKNVRIWLLIVVVHIYRLIKEQLNGETLPTIQTIIMWCAHWVELPLVSLKQASAVPLVCGSQYHEAEFQNTTQSQWRIKMIVIVRLKCFGREMVIRTNNTWFSCTFVTRIIYWLSRTSENINCPSNTLLFKYCYKLICLNLHICCYFFVFSAYIAADHSLGSAYAVLGCSASAYREMWDW
jgi:hypothetical protein